MIGEARHPGESSAFAAVLDTVAARLRDGLHELRAAARARFGEARSGLVRPPQGAIFGAPVIPTVRYRDVPAAISWLCRAFGMRVHRVANDENGAPCYAQLIVGTGMLIVAPIEDTPLGRLMVQPDEIGGVETQVCYLCVANARRHYARAKAAGAAIIIDIEDEVNRGRGYSCRDPEGHVWSFGTYDPWEMHAPSPPLPARSLRRTWGHTWRRIWGLRGLKQGLVVLALFALAVALVPALIPQPAARAGTAMTEPEPLAPTALDEAAPEASGPAARYLAEREMEVQRLATEAAERTAAETRAQLAEARSALEQAEREAATTRTQIDALRRAKESAERAALEARGRLAAAQEAAERAREEASAERAKRHAADRAAIRAKRRAAIVSVRSRLRSSRTWCYNANVPNPASNAGARLAGFCRG
jgi:uncharacterized glyoxalase superfamily protein PhnB